MPIRRTDVSDGPEPCNYLLRGFVSSREPRFEQEARGGR